MSDSEWQPSALGSDFPDTHTIRSHRVLDPPKPRRRPLVIGMIVVALAIGALVAQSAIGGATDAGHERPVRGDALPSGVVSLAPPLTAVPPTPSLSPSEVPTSTSPSTSPTAPRTSAPATTPPAPAATAPPTFVPVTIQAEAATLTGTASAVACTLCSGGWRVGYISQGSAVVVRVDIPLAGRRTVRVTYETDGSREIRVQLNGVDVETRWLPGTSWEEPMTFEFSAMIPAGTVELRFYNDINPAPDIDAVTIS